jgi:PAS domain S-box-containing protein
MFGNKKLDARALQSPEWAGSSPAFAGDRSVSALAESEARLSLALTAGRLGYWELDLKTRHLFTSEIYKANWGRQPDEAFTYETLLKSIHPDDLELHERLVGEAIEKGGRLDVEYRAIWPDGSIHWLRVRGHAVYDEIGVPLRMAGVSLDVTDRKRTEESLREETRTLEILNRTNAALAGDLELERIVQTVADAATELSGAQFGAFFYNVDNENGQAFMLYSLSGVPREAFAAFPMPGNTELFDPTFRGHGIIRSDDITKDPRYGRNPPFHGQPDGHLPVVSYMAVPVVSRSGEVIGGLFFGHGQPGVFTKRAERLVAGLAAQAAIVMDNARLFKEVQSELAERRRVEKHQDLLLAELNHRVKNTLAIVLSIATQTLRNADTPEGFRAGFEARIMALAGAHDLLTDSNWQGASVRAIFERVLGPYSIGGEPRHMLSGDKDIRVGPKTAVALVMALNELATNAAKYGALSNTGGRVNVTWQLDEDSDPARLEVRWEETGGPPVKKPTRKGFGSRLIRGLSEDAAGRVAIDYARTGVVCTFDLPVPMEGEK